MKKILCILFISAAALGLYFSVSYFAGINNYKERLFQEIENKTGLKASCENAELKKALSPYITLHLHHFGALYPDNTKFVQVKEADISIKILPLLFKKIEIKNINLERPIVNITIYKDFSNSIEKYLKVNEIIPDIYCRNYKIKFNDEVSRKNFYLEGAVLDMEGLDRIKASGALFEAEKEYIRYDADIQTGLSSNKRRLELKAKADNINIENAVKLAGAVFKILDVKIPLNEIRTDGILNADFQIKSDFKKLESSGKIELKSASIMHKELPHPVKDINADINFDSGKIKIVKAQGSVNNTPVVLSGSIQSDLKADLKLHSDGLDLKTAAAAFIPKNSLPVEIKNGKFNFISEIKGNLNKDYEIKSNVTVNNLEVIEKTYKIPVKASKLEFTLENKDVYIPRNLLEIDGLPVYISGRADKTGAELDFESRMPSLQAAKLLSQYIKQPYKALGNLDIKGTAKINPGVSELKSRIKADKDNYISYAVIKELLNKPSQTDIELETDKNAVKIKNISLSNGENPVINISGTIETVKEPVLHDIKVNIPSSVTIASNFAGGGEISAKADINLNGSINKPVITGSAKILNCSIGNYFTELKNADILFESQNIHLTAPDTAVKNSVFNISADIEPEFITFFHLLPGPPPQGGGVREGGSGLNNKNPVIIKNLQINSLNLDLNSLFDIIHSERNIFLKPFITIKKGSAVINEFKMLDLKAHDTSADFTLDKNILKISDINASAYSGSIEGAAEYELNSGFLKIDMTGKDLDIRTSMRDLLKLEDKFTGRTDVKAKLSMMTGSYNTVMKSLSGTAEYKAKNGALGTLGRFEYYLNAQNLLKSGLNSDLNKVIRKVSKYDTGRYNFSSGRISFHDGYVSAEEIYTQGSEMSLFITGEYNILTNIANLYIYGRIADEISKNSGSFGNTVLLPAPERLIKEIPPLYRNNAHSNIFRVNIFGNITAFNPIKSFNLITPDLSSIEENRQEEETENIPLPEFSDL